MVSPLFLTVLYRPFFFKHLRPAIPDLIPCNQRVRIHAALVFSTVLKYLINRMFISLYKTEAEGNAAYFHIHDHQRHLFDKYTLTVIRGEETGKSVEKQYTFETQDEKDGKIKELFTIKIKEGFKILYTYPREYLPASFAGQVS
jgi:hypothetical protein